MPNYLALARLFLEPLIEDPSSLTVDSEITRGGNRIWLRVSFDAKDKGRVLGRGGRTLQAIRQVLAAAATLAGQTVYLDLYDPNPKPPEPRATGSRPIIQARSEAADSASSDLL